MVPFNSLEWTKHGLNEFKKYFPYSKIAAVDHTTTQEHKEFVYKNFDYVIPRVYNTRQISNSHGRALNLLRAWCRCNAIKIMVLLEPDIEITGKKWWNNLLSPLLRGEAYMTSGVRHRCGYLHPCPSAWMVDKITDTFEWRKVTSEERQHPLRKEIDRLYRLHPDGDLDKGWDTGGKNWFLLAKQNKAKLVDCPDFKHFYNSGDYKNRGKLAPLISNTFKSHTFTNGELPKKYELEYDEEFDENYEPDEDGEYENKEKVRFL